MKILLPLILLLSQSLLIYSGPIPDGVYYLINRAFLQTIEVSGSSYEDAAPIDLSEITNNPSQQFQLTSLGGEFYKITALHSWKVLTAPSFMSANNEDIIQWQDGDETNQHWNIFSKGNTGFYTIQSRYSGKVITGAYANYVLDQAQMRADSMIWVPPKRVIQTTIDGSANQDFIFVKASPSVMEVMVPMAAEANNVQGQAMASEGPQDDVAAPVEGEGGVSETVGTHDVKNQDPVMEPVQVDTASGRGVTVGDSETMEVHDVEALDPVMEPTQVDTAVMGVTPSGSETVKDGEGIPGQRREV